MRFCKIIYTSTGALKNNDDLPHLQPFFGTPSRRWHICFIPLIRCIGLAGQLHVGDAAPTQRNFCLYVFRLFSCSFWHYCVDEHRCNEHDAPEQEERGASPCRMQEPQKKAAGEKIPGERANLGWDIETPGRVQIRPSGSSPRVLRISKHVYGDKDFDSVRSISSLDSVPKRDHRIFQI